MPKHFFQTVPSQQLLIIILTQNANENGPILEIPAHTIRHVPLLSKKGVSEKLHICTRSKASLAK